MKIKNIIIISMSVLLTSCVFIPKTESNLQYVYDMYGLNYNRGNKFYLQHNVWYKEPMNISSMNYLEGKIIPVGTEIKFIKSFPGYVIFKTVNNGEKYKIINDSEVSLLSDQLQFHRIIGNKNPVEGLNLSKEYLQQIKAGRILEGMPKKFVLLSYGNPPSVYNPPKSKTTWVYLMNEDLKTRHVVFKDDKVVYVFDC
ncbi:MAG: hypothetical protein K9M56_06230 [Victivallales bacterium]|nr:hypothetical protein [Victivallales bacterium]